MPDAFMNVRVHVRDPVDESRATEVVRSPVLRGAARSGDAGPAFTSDEAAARYHLNRVLGSDDRVPVRGLTAPQRPQVLPELRLLEVRGSPSRRPEPLRDDAVGSPPGGTTLVQFEQTRAEIPIFGSIATVEIDRNRDLVSIDATVADVQGVSPLAALSPADALKRVAEAAHVPVTELKGISAPKLTFYVHERTGSWHLAYLFHKIPTGAAGPRERGHGLGRSPRELAPLVNYLVDAHGGELLLQYSATPLLVLCEGKDEDGQVQRFFASQKGDAFSMYDPLRSIRTYDLCGADLASPFPQSEITSATSKPWRGTAAVSAHVSAMRIHQFLATVLGRDSIDDRGMELVSVVNCTYKEDQSPPEWHNAVWYNNRMWYGQARDEAGNLRSFARYLDIIAHELTHGITEFTAGLVYRYESGALNESISDIFGVIVRNWFTAGPDSDVETWTWEIGRELGPRGLPLRDLSDPRRTGSPDHMDDFINTECDSGGVHANSNIHNKAAFNLLTAQEPDGSHALRPSDVAVLYYVALQRLSCLAGFRDMRNALRSTAKTYFGDASERERMLTHIDAAYARVGIE